MPTEELSGPDLGDAVSDETTARFVHHAAALHVGLGDHLGPPPDPHLATSIVVIDASSRREMCANDLSAVIARAESTAAQRVIVVGDPAARERADVVLELPCSLDGRGLHEVMPVAIRLVRNRFGPVGARRVVFRERTAGFEDAAEDDGASPRPAGCVRSVAWA